MAVEAIGEESTHRTQTSASEDDELGDSFWAAPPPGRLKKPQPKKKAKATAEAQTKHRVTSGTDDEESGEEDARRLPKTYNGRDQSTFDSNPFGVTRCAESGCPFAGPQGRPFNGIYNLCKHLRGHESKKKVDEKKYSKHKIVRCTECSILTNEISGHLKRYCKKKPSLAEGESTLASARGEPNDSQKDGPATTSEAIKHVFAEGRAPPVLEVPKDSLEAFCETTAVLLGEVICNMERSDESSTAMAGLLHAPLLASNSKGKELSATALSRLLTELNERKSIHMPQAVLSVVEDVHSRDGTRKPRPPPTMQDEERYPDLPSSGLSKAISKVVKLAAANRCSKALATLEQAAEGNDAHISDDLANSDEVRGELSALHPPSIPSRDSLPHRIPRDTSCLQLTMEELLQGVADLPALSAAAMSPWTFELIKQVTFGPNPDVAKGVLRMFNLILEGKGGDPSLWTLSRLVALRKPNGSIRPIAVGDVWLRLLGKVVAKKLSKDMGEILAPHNLGVGIPGGAEIAVHAASLYARLLRERAAGRMTLDDNDDDPWCLIALDFKNAFNTLGRLAIYKAIEANCPELLAFFHWSYGKEASLRLGDGSFICFSSTGVRQGDPLGPLFFCLGIHGVLAEVARNHPNAHSIFYLDDGTMMGRRSHLRAALLELQTKLKALGLELNLVKTLGWDPLLVKDTTTPDGLKWVNTGVTILGGPVGGALSGSTETYASSFAQKELSKMAAPLDLLRSLPKLTALTLLGTCINARPTYLARTISPEQFRTAAADFDRKVDGVCSWLADWAADLPEISKRIRGLPRSLSGSSLRRMEACCGPAFAASIIHALWAIHKDHRWLWDLLTLVAPTDFLRAEHDLVKTHVANFVGFTSEGVTLVTIEDQSTLPPLAALAATQYEAHVEAVVARDLEDAQTAPTGRRFQPSISPELRKSLDDQEDGKLPAGLRQKNFQGPLDELEHGAIVSHLNADKKEGHAAFFLSGKHSMSGVYMSQRGLAKRRHTGGFSDQHVTSNIRARWALPIHNDDMLRRCHCGKKDPHLLPGRDDYHCLECHRGGPFGHIYDRHNRLRDTWKELLPGVLGGKAGKVTVLSEQKVTPLHPSAEPREIDILLTLELGNRNFLLDMAVTHPAGATHLKGGSNLRPGVGALAIERRKMALYKKSIGSKRTAIEFFPIVFETGGLMGKQATRFINLIAKLSKTKTFNPARAVNNLLCASRTVIAKSNQRLISIHQGQTDILGADRQWDRLFETPPAAPTADLSGQEEAASFYDPDSDEERIPSVPTPSSKSPSSPPDESSLREADAFLATFAPTPPQPPQPLPTPPPFALVTENLYTLGVGTLQARALADASKVRQTLPSSSKFTSDNSTIRCGCTPSPLQSGCNPQTCSNARSSIECTDMSCGLCGPLFDAPLADLSLSQPDPPSPDHHHHPHENATRCLNRRIQVVPYPTLKLAPLAGSWRVTCESPLGQGDFAGEYLGLVTPLTTHVRSEGAPLALPFAPSRQGNEICAPLSTENVIATDRYGNLLRFLSQDCNPNCKVEVWWTHGLPHLMIVALRDIPAEEGLSVNYYRCGSRLHRVALYGPDGPGRCDCPSCFSGKDPRGPVAYYTDGSGKTLVAVGHDRDPAKAASTGPKQTPTSVASWGVTHVQRPFTPAGAFMDKDAGEELCSLFAPVCTSTHLKSGVPNPFFIGASRATNQSAEITGIGEAMLHFRFFSDRETATIYSDSQYAISVIKGKCLSKDNAKLADYVRALYEELNRRKQRITLLWVKAHDGKRWNERADALANLGATATCTEGRYGNKPALRNGFPEDHETLPSRSSSLPHTRNRPLSTSTTPLGPLSATTVQLSSDEEDGPAVTKTKTRLAIRREVSLDFQLFCRRQGKPSSQALLEARLAPAPPEEQDAALRILNGTPSEDRARADKYNIPMTITKLQCLKLEPDRTKEGNPDNWLNDEVINFYGNMLQERDSILRGIDPAHRPSHIFSSQFLGKLLLEKQGYSFENVRRWTKAIPDVRELRLIFFPLCRRKHWTLALIRMGTKSLEYYDSHGGDGTEILEGLWHWLEDELLAKKLPPPVRAEWTFRTTCPTPQQTNDLDCGVFAALIMDHLFEDLVPSFGQRDIPGLRIKMATDILRGSLNYPYCGGETPPPAIFSSPLAPGPSRQANRGRPTDPTPHSTTSTPPTSQEGTTPFAGSQRRSIRYGCKLVGAMMHKTFPDETTGLPRLFAGKVASYSSRLYTIEYEDDDSEQMSWDELQPFLDPIAPTPTPSTTGSPSGVNPPAAITAAFSSNSPPL